MLLLLILATTYGCSNEIEFNTPAFQGNKNNQLWRAVAFNASVNAQGNLIITGTNNFETVRLIVPSATLGTYVVGEVNTIEAQYIDAEGEVYSTNNIPDEEVSVYPELGEIIVEEIGENNSYVTGTFRFLAFTANGQNSVGYSRGIFFKVPLMATPQN